MFKSLSWHYNSDPSHDLEVTSSIYCSTMRLLNKGTSCNLDLLLIQTGSGLNWPLERVYERDAYFMAAAS